MNNTVVVNHNDLFIYIDAGYPGSFHDVSYLHASSLNRNWRDYFTHTNNYFEYVLGDPGYQGRDQYILRRLRRQEQNLLADNDVINAYDNMHVGFRVQVEWGMGGLKRKWKRLLNRFDSTKSKYIFLFNAACYLTNYLHRRSQDFTYHIEEHNDDENDDGWDGVL